MPLVYNDFMNTLMGQPSTQALIPLVKEAGALGLDVFCIDAGWFASPAIGDWWATIGEWNEAKDRFDDGGLARICETILDQGMRVGLWLEPEIVGADSPAVDQLPEDAFFRRHGQKVREDRKSTRLNSSHVAISYAVFCLKKNRDALSAYGGADVS